MAANGQLSTVGMTNVGGHLMRADVAIRWLALVAACYLATGFRLGITEAYRSLAEQDRIFRARYTPGWPSGAWYAGTYWRKRAGVAVAAVPGNSNHGLAIALDINNYSNPIVWRWLLDHAAGFGFSWAQGKASGEPWHWVFVGGGFVPAAVVQVPIDTTALQGGGMFYIQCNPYPAGQTRSDTGPYAGATYRRDERTGAWRAVTNIETLAIVPDLEKHGLAVVYKFDPADLQLLFAVDGLLEQAALPANPPKWGPDHRPLEGLGAPSGRVIFPGSPAPLGTWHAV
jgi:hypothetical protein